MIYQYEWSAEPTQLTPGGQEHLAQIAQRLPQVCLPIIIEPASDPSLNEPRRMAVLQALANYHAPIVPERVVIGRPEAEGLYGLEAAGIARSMISTQGGQGASGGGIGGSSLGGGGSSLGGSSMGSSGGMGAY